MLLYVCVLVLLLPLHTAVCVARVLYVRPPRIWPLVYVCPHTTRTLLPVTENMCGKFYL